MLQRLLQRLLHSTGCPLVCYLQGDTTTAHGCARVAARQRDVLVLLSARSAEGGPVICRNSCVTSRRAWACNAGTTESSPDMRRKRSTAQHSTAQHSTAQHSTAQHSTAILYAVCIYDSRDYCMAKNICARAAEAGQACIGLHKAISITIMHWSV